MNFIERGIMRLAARVAIARSDPSVAVQYLLKEVIKETHEMFPETNAAGIDAWMRTQLDAATYKFYHQHEKL